MCSLKINFIHNYIQFEAAPAHFHDCMLFYGNVSITEGQIPEVSANIPHKCKVFPALKSPQKKVGFQRQITVLPSPLDNISYLPSPKTMFMSLRGCEALGSSGRAAAYCESVSAVQMCVQSTCRLILRDNMQPHDSIRRSPPFIKALTDSP